MKLFLNPSYIAVVGASSDPRKVGRRVFDNILENKKRKVFPINIKEKKIAGFLAYSSIEDLPIKNFSKLLVVIVVPAKYVFTEIQKCSRLGVKNVVIISAGFKESGPEGQKMEEAIKNLAEKHQINILGPNCLGYINGKDNLNVSFSDYRKNKQISQSQKAAKVALISQSGAIGSAVLDSIFSKNINLSAFISLGNKSSLNENDFLEYFYHDQETDLVILYLEEIVEGRRFLNLISRLSQIKPVAVLKAGRTALGEEMALSHTGSLAGSYQVVLSSLERAGAIVLEEIDEIYSLIQLMREPLKNISGNLAVLSNAGGPLVLLSDKFYENKIFLNNFSPQTKKKIKERASSFVHVKNPLDILGDASAQRYLELSEIVLKDPKIDLLLIILTPQSMTEIKATAEAISALKKKYKNKMILTSFMGGDKVIEGQEILSKNLIPSFSSIDSATLILIKFIKYLKKKKDLKVLFPREKRGSSQRKQSIKEAFRKNPQGEMLDYLESFAFIKKEGLSILETKALDSRKIKKIKYPITIKYTGENFLHKSDQRGVFLNIKNKKEARKILNNFERLKKRGKISSKNEVVYQKMIEINDNYQELILGFKQDPVFGPVILLGRGGIYAEIYQDSVLSLADLNLSQVKKIIRDLKIYPILNGARAKKKINFTLLEKTILKVARIARENPDILEMDINPLLINDKEIIILDLRIIKNKH